MAKTQVCAHCSDKHQCQAMYHSMGHSKAPSVLFSVLIAFVLPVVVFFTLTAVFDTLLAQRIENARPGNLLSVLWAAGSAIGSIFLVGYVGKIAWPGHTYRKSRCSKIKEA